MARCRNCNALIPDGKELCEKCEKLNNDSINNESYLDSLLQAISSEDLSQAEKNERRQTGRFRRDKEHVREEHVREKNVQEKFVQEEHATDDNTMPQDLLEELAFLNDSGDNSSAKTDYAQASADAYSIMDESSSSDDEDDEFDRLLHEIETDSSAVSEDEIALAAKDYDRDQSETASEEGSDTDSLMSELDSILSANYTGEKSSEEQKPESDQAMENSPVQEVEPETDLMQEESAIPVGTNENAAETDQKAEMESPTDMENTQDLFSGEQSSGSSSDDWNQFSDINDLLNNLDLLDEDLPSEKSDEEINQKSDVTSQSQEASDSGAQDDILDLINSLYNSDIPDGSNAGFGTEEDLERGNSPDDVEGVFSDALGAVDSLNDLALADIPELDDDGNIVSKSDKKNKKKKKKKHEFFRRIFGNVKVERSDEEIARMKEKVIADAQAKENAAEAKKVQAAAKKAEQQKKKAEAKAAAAKKKQEDAKKKAETAKLKKDEKEKKKREIQELLDEIDDDEGRINRVGASVIFGIFAAAAAFVIIGTQIYSYSVNITNAQKDFGNQHYTQAYDDIAGIQDIKDEDQTFVMQVITVMITQKQLNSFNNYYAMGQYPQALDSLIKGLKRYDKYAGLASVIEVESDMNYVRGMMVEKLEDVFHLDEQEAKKLAAIEDEEEYTARIYEIAGRLTETEQAADSR